MSITDLEKSIQNNLKWSSIEDIPSFPLKSFSEVIQKIESNEFSLGIDYSTSNEVAKWLYGSVYTYFFLLFSSPPFIIAVLSIILAVALSNYWFLFGIPIGFIGQFVSNPYNPLKTFFNIVALIAVFVLIWSVLSSSQSMIFLSLFFIIAFLANKFIYSFNQNKLKKVALESESIFIYLYQTGKLGVRDNSSGEMYWDYEFKKSEYIKSENTNPPNTSVPSNVDELLENSKETDKYFSELVERKDLLDVLKKHGKKTSFLEESYWKLMGGGAGPVAHQVVSDVHLLEEFIQMDKSGTDIGELSFHFLDKLQN